MGKSPWKLAAWTEQHQSMITFGNVLVEYKRNYKDVPKVKSEW